MVWFDYDFNFQKEKILKNNLLDGLCINTTNDNVTVTVLHIRGLINQKI